MAKNKEFLAALDDTSGLHQAGTTEELSKALEALLEVDLDKDLRQFPLAILSHKDFWKKYPSRKDLMSGADVSLLDTDVKAKKELIVMKQLAAKQRVLIALDAVKDENIIVGILAHNPDQCREYLAKKKLIPADKVAGWSASAPVVAAQAAPPVGGAIPAAKLVNLSKNILTDEAVAIIQKKAHLLLLLNYVKKPENAIHLVALSQAKNKEELLAVFAKMKLPAAAIPHQGYPLHEAVVNTVQALLSQKAAARTEVKEQFAEYVKTLEIDTGDFPKVLAALDSPQNKVFLELIKTYEPSFEQLDPVDIAWAKGLLGAQYLKADLPQKSKASQSQLLDVLNAADNNAMQHAVKTMLRASAGQHGYLKDTITDKTMASFKRLLLPELLKQAQVSQYDILGKLEEANNLATFKATLNQLGVTAATWIESTDIPPLKREIRIRQLELALEHNSPFNAPHPVLLNTLLALPADKQRDILKNTSCIVLLTQAQDKETLEHFLGKNVDDAALTAIIEENKKNIPYLGLHNKAVAQCLHESNIRLDEKKVDNVNKVLRDFDNDFAKAASYKKFVDDITVAIGARGNTLYAQFNLNADGSVSSEKANKEAIAKQQTNNKDLLELYKINPPIHSQALVAFFLRLNKQSPLSKQDIEAIAKQLDTSDSASDFVKFVGTKTTDKWLLADLRRELTSAEFIRVRDARIQLGFSDPALFKTSIDTFNRQYLALKEARLTLGKNQETLEPMAKLEQVDIYNLAFLSKARLEARIMQEKYSQLFEQCKLILEKLNRNQSELNSLLNSLPAAPAPADAETINALRLQLEAETQENTKLYAFYAQVQDKLTGDKGLLKAIELARADNAHYSYQPLGIKCQPYNSDGTLPAKTPSPARVTTASINTPLTQFELMGGNNFVYDLEYTNNEKSNFQAQGRFTQQFKYAQSTTINKAMQVVKNPACTFTITQPPKQTPPAVDSPENQEKLKAANVAYYMNVAAQLIIANSGNPPTKQNPACLLGTNKEELRYMWTALVVLGEGNPKFGIDAINVVDTTSFDPSAEKGILGFKSDSLYKEVFTNPLYAKQIAECKKDLQTFLDAGKEVDSMRDKSKHAVSDFKKKLDNSKINLKETDRLLNEEGPATNLFKP